MSLDHAAPEIRVRGADRAGSVRRHSERVRHLRLAVPALAAGLAVTYAFSATPPRIDRAFEAQFAELVSDEGGAKLASPRYSGEDLEGQPFEVEAITAVRAPDDPSEVDLDQPRAQRITEDGRAVTVTAADGLYNEVGKTMRLNRDVALEERTASGRFVLNTDSADLDLDKQIVTSTSEIRGQGDVGSVRADRGTLYQGEDRLVLEGDVQISLAPKKADTEAAEGQSSADNEE